MSQRRYNSRRGAATVEFAIVGSAACLILIGLLVGGLGVFRYQQVASLARSASRWASVHGTQYASFTGNSAATATDVYNNAIAPYAAGLNPSNLTYSVAWNNSNSPSYTAVVSGNTVSVANTVAVTVNYQWLPEAFLGAKTLSSSSVSVMSF
jgi:Flp pilus assembly protein TadG